MKVKSNLFWNKNTDLINFKIIFDLVIWHRFIAIQWQVINIVQTGVS